MGKNLKFQLLLSSILFMPNISAAALAASTEYDGSSARSWSSDTSDGCEGSCICGAERKLEGINERKATILKREAEFESRKRNGEDDLDRLREDFTQGLSVIRFLKFLEIPADIERNWAECRFELSTLESAITTIRERLSATEDVGEREVLESDILRLVSKRDVESERLNVLAAYRVLPELRGLLEACHGGLESHLEPLSEVVDNWYKILSRYARELYFPDEEAESNLPYILSDLDENDAVYNRVRHDLYKILDMIHLIQGWVLIAQEYIGFPMIHAEPVGDVEQIDDSVFERKQQLQGILTALSLLMPDLQKAPLHFKRRDIDDGLRLLRLDSEIATIKDKLVLLREGARFEADSSSIDEELSEIKAQIVVASLSLGESPENFSELMRLSEEYKKLETTRTCLATVDVERLQEIEDLEELLARKVFEISGLINAIEEGDEEGGYTSDFGECADDESND
jgi:hypothetical protein